MPVQVNFKSVISTDGLCRESNKNASLVTSLTSNEIDLILNDSAKSGSMKSGSLKFVEDRIELFEEMQ